MSRTPRALLSMSREVKRDLFTPSALDRLTRIADVDPDAVVADFADAPDLDQVEVLVTGWGSPPVDADVLRRAPALRAVVHTAGTVKALLAPACWDRGIVVSSATEANAIPVAEYTVAAILFAQKRVVEISRLYAEHRDVLRWADRFPGFGNYRKVVGVVGASRIGRRVLELLSVFEFELLVTDPYLTAAEAERLGARLVDLDELLAVADTVSLHAPSLPETANLIDRDRLRLLRDGATLINTARGSLVDTEALTEELASGRIHAVIDVTTPEVLPPSSPLYDLPNVLLTPHIAGSLGGELDRLADRALDELARYADGLPFEYPVLADLLTRSA